jgi:hypothetical protein
MMKLMQKLFLISFILLSIVSFSSLVNIYEKRGKIAAFFKEKTVAGTNYQLAEQDIFWANEILNGGYILHFRHAERDKWIDVQMYDALESHLHNNGMNNTRYAENDYFSQAVCLNNRGKVQAKAIGESLKFIGLPIGRVHSSVSCRARQTAELSFGRYDELHQILVHRGPYNEEEKERVSNLNALYTSFTKIPGKNIIVSAHNGVINCDMFVNKKCPRYPELEEGGFYVLKNSTEGLRFEHEFHNFNDFNRVFYKR